MSSRKSTSRWARLVQLLLGLAVSAGCLWFAVRGMLKDPNAWPQIKTAFRDANYWLLIPSWIGLFTFYYLKAWRWRLLLAPMGLFNPLRQLFAPMLIGFAFNNLLPAHLGEFVRVFVFSRRSRLKAAAVFSSVALERVFDILAIVSILACGLFFVKGLDPGVRKSAMIGGGFALVVAAASAAFVTWTGPFVKLAGWFLNRTPVIPAHFRDRLLTILESAAQGLSALRNPGLLLGIVLTSLAQWAVNGWLMHLSLAAFGIHVSMWVSCILLGVVAFAVTIPSSPGYFGVIQLCFMSVLKLMSDDNPTVKQEAVFAASVLYQMAQYVPVTLIGLFFFLRTGLHVSDVQEEIDSVEADIDSTASDAPIDGERQALHNSPRTTP